MASAFLSSLLSKAGQVLGRVRRSAVSPSSSSDPRSSLLKDLEKLERTLKRIQAVLHDAEEREIRDEAVKLWLKEIKELAYKSEDVLDEYQYEVLLAQVEGRASRKRKRMEGDDEEEVSIPDGMGDRIREIRERFDEISEDRKRLSLKEEDGERRVCRTTYPEQTSHMVDESSIYGRERDKQEVIDLLFSEGVGNGISVIPIVGKGGLGKTTIAQLVYSDPKVKQYFHLTGWVCVSDDFDVPRLTEAIIESLTSSSCHVSQLSKLQDTLKEEVKGKRVLLVLDDVWNEQRSRWESLRNPFVGAETATIIVTCRNDSVAEIMQTVHPYRPGYLSLEESWSLFRHYAFGGRDPEEQPCLADINKQIVMKCSGLPLALKSIGSLLRYATDENSWKDVIESDIWEVDENDEILPALRLSYSRMPAHLKPCFVYCSIFPKDYQFEKDVLVRLWMAQGYIPSGGRRRMEDIGHEYFNDLQRRSFFDSYYDRFNMHDMIHDLAKSLAGNEVRHLYVKDPDEFVNSLHSYDFSALRTLLLPDLDGNRTRIAKVIKYLPQLRCLRALEFCWEQAHEIPDFLSNLKHLRHLYITSKYMNKLPESVCLLYHLQTLVLYCGGLTELPESLGNLTNLRHLHTRGVKKFGIVYLPFGIVKLPNLQSLVGSFRVQGGIGVLKDLVNLEGYLCITGLRNLVNIEDARDAGLKYRPKLEELRIRWDDRYAHYEGLHVHLEASPKDNEVVPADEKREEAMLEYLQPHANLKKLHIEQYGGSKFPDWVGNPLSFASLQEIHISFCTKVRSLPLYIHDSLGKWDVPIPKCMLVTVGIHDCEQLTSIAGLHDLRSLKELWIYYCPQLRLSSEEGLPSNLQYLYINQCQQLTSLPGMQNLTSLRALEITDCPQLQLLSEEGLPSTLQYLYIMQCQQLTSLPGMQNLTSLRALGITYCPQLRLLSEEGLPSKLQELHIEECQNLTSLSGMQNLTSLRTLEITGCPQLQLLSEEELPSNLQYLHIEGCQELTSLLRMQNLTSLQKLTIKNCPQLRLLSEEGLPFKLEKLHIEGCQELTSLPGIQNLTYLGALNIKNCPYLRLLLVGGLPSKFENLHIEECQRLTSLTGMQNLTSIEELTIKNCQLWLLSKEGLTSSLQNLHIKECQQLTSSSEMQNIASLRELYIENCPQLQFLSEEGLPSTLQNLHIKECQQLTSLSGMQNNAFLRELYIENCPQLQFLSEEGLPSTLRNLHIKECQQLTSLSGMQNIASLRELYIENCPQLQFLSEEGLPLSLKCWTIKECQQSTSLSEMRDGILPKKLSIRNCPKLQIMAEDQLERMPQYVQIVDCPGLSNWCQIRNINCIQVASGNKLTISNAWENIMHGFDDLTSADHLYFCGRWNSFLGEDSIFVPEELTIWSCTSIPPLKHLPELASLRSLVIKDCPRILFLPCELIPSTLESLVVDSCEDLTFLPLAQQNRDALEVLRLVNCPKLQWVQGLNCLFFPAFLIIERCPRLRLPQHHQQPSIPPRVEIAEETENEETVDDGSQEKKVFGLYGH